MIALDATNGKTIWEYKYPSKIEDFSYGAGPHSTPLIVGERLFTIGTNKQLFAFDKQSGKVLWSHDLVEEFNAPVLLIRPVVKAGNVLWSYPHDPGNDLNINTPLWGADNILFLSSGYKAGSRALRLKQEGSATMVDEVWFNGRVRYMFLNGLRLGDYLYGANGDLGPSFLTALDVKTGQVAWQHRGIGRVSMVYADGKAIILVGTTLYARDREKIVALDLGRQQ